MYLATALDVWKYLRFCQLPNCLETSATSPLLPRQMDLMQSDLAHL